jgi:ATPase subunit of ABC transporter with duplicated ATPase domains
MYSDAHTHFVNPFGENALEPKEIDQLLKEARDKGVVLETKDLTKNFGKLAALDKVSLAINEKEVTFLIGPNGVEVN